jgi:DnaJ-class molecular chaperone
MKSFYVVTMYRYQDREKHSYVIGLFDKFEDALRAGVHEELDRGGKYSPEILEFNNFGTSHKRVFRLGEKIPDHYICKKCNGSGVDGDYEDCSDCGGYRYIFS